MAHQCPNGNMLYYLKEDDDDAIINSFCIAIRGKKDYHVYPAFEFEHYDLDREQVRKYIMAACCISDILAIPCPQIQFTCGTDGWNAGRQLIMIPDGMTYVETIACLAHEMRHVFQQIYNSEILEGYILPKSDNDMKQYLHHAAEIDAEAFGRRMAGITFDIDPECTDLYKCEDGKLTKKIRKRAGEIKIDITSHYQSTLLLKEMFAN